MTGADLLDGIFLILQTVVAKVAVAVVMVPLRAVRVTSTVANGNDYDSKLCQAVNPREILAPGDVVGLDLGTGINIVADRVDLGRVEVIGLVHGSVEVGNSVGGLDLEALWELVTSFKEEAQVCFFEVENLLSAGTVEGYIWSVVNP